MSILEQLKESLSPERIGTRPYILCVFLQDIVCGLFVFFFFAWANWITAFSLLSYAFHSFLLLFLLLYWDVEVELYLEWCTVKPYWKLWRRNCQSTPYVSLPSSPPLEPKDKKAHPLLSLTWKMEPLSEQK